MCVSVLCVVRTKWSPWNLPQSASRETECLWLDMNLVGRLVLFSDYVMMCRGLQRNNVCSGVVLEFIFEECPL